MSKKVQIEQLIAAGLNNKQISDRVDCHEAYIRVVRCGNVGKKYPSDMAIQRARDELSYERTLKRLKYLSKKLGKANEASHAQ